MLMFPGVIDRYREFFLLMMLLRRFHSVRVVRRLSGLAALRTRLGVENFILSSRDVTPRDHLKIVGWSSLLPRLWRRARPVSFALLPATRVLLQPLMGQNISLGKPLLLVPAGEIAIGKLAQAMAYGARILAVNGSFDDALTTVKGIVLILGY
ncbi:MAG: hypothetical protein Ct9H300mP19_17870 [Dehalococcoidia bacterium]|nr:MAG: hypothetical protein Ct9H300mP19_17870 [Dehalococcoidia bacterium]